MSLLLILPALFCLDNVNFKEENTTTGKDSYLISVNQNIDSDDKGPMYSYRHQSNHQPAPRDREEDEFGLIDILILTLLALIFYFVTFRIFSFISWIAIGFTVWQMVHSFLMLDYNFALALSPTLLVGLFFAYRKLKSIEIHD